MDRVCIATLNGLMLKNPLPWYPRETRPQGIQITAELLALIISPEGELLLDELIRFLQFPIDGFLQLPQDLEISSISSALRFAKILINDSNRSEERASVLAHRLMITVETLPNPL